MNFEDIKNQIKNEWTYKEVVEALMAIHDSTKHGVFLRKYPKRANIFHDRDYQLALTEVVNEMKRP